MSLLIENPDGATPLTADDIQGLKHPHVQTRGQLNGLEAANILQGQIWLGNIKTITVDDIFSRDFVNELHKKLFGDVWQWAGAFRLREVNIGIEPSHIPTRLHDFLEDAKCWVEYKHYSELELCARIQHGLVFIHPFVNGNGRHSRIMTDVVRVFLLDKPPLKWANANIDDQGIERKAYLETLYAADRGDFSKMITYLQELDN